MKLLIYSGAALIAGLCIPSPTLADSFDSKAREGISHYNREEFDQAASQFEASQLEQPGNSGVTYNLANSQYRLGRYEAAIESYRKILSDKSPPELQQKTHFNMGNAYYRMGYLKEAITSYKKALALDSNDMDSKFNLEWTRKQQEQAQQSGQVGPRDKNILQKPAISENANNPPPPQKQEQDTPDASQQESQEPQTAHNQPPDKNRQAPSSLSSSPDVEEPTEQDKNVQEAFQEMTKMSPEEAERWLGSLSEDLKKIARRQMQGSMKDMFADHDKDW